MFTIINGREKYKVTRLTDGAESFTDDLTEAYKMAGWQLAMGHDVLLQSRHEDGRVEWQSENHVLNGSREAMA